MKQQKVSRRQLLRLGAMSAVGLAAAACAAPPAQPAAKPAEAPSKPTEQAKPAEATKAPEPTAAPAAEGAKKIQVYTMAWQPACVEAVKNSMDTFNKANGSRIMAEYVQGDWGKARDYLTTSMAGGVPPQIAHGITAWTNEYGEQGNYLDLTNLIEASDLKTDLDERALNSAVNPLSSKIYGMPFSWEVGVMYINEDRFKEAGIDVPTKGWKWEDFYSAAKKVTKNKEYYGLGVNLGGSQATEDIIAWIWQAGGDVMGNKGGKWEMDLAGADEALKLWHDMVKKDAIVSPDSFGAPNLFEAFPLGAFSIMQNGCWARRIITEGKPKFAWRMVPLPYNKRHANSSEPQTWSIPTEASKKGESDAAWEVLQWISNKENQVAIAAGDWLFPTRKSALSDPRFNTTENDWNVGVGEIPYGIPYPKHPAWAEFDERVMAPAIQQYLQDEIALEAALSTMKDEGTKLIAKYTKA